MSMEGAGRARVHQSSLRKGDNHTNQSIDSGYSKDNVGYDASTNPVTTLLDDKRAIQSQRQQPQQQFHQTRAGNGRSQGQVTTTTTVGINDQATHQSKQQQQQLHQTWYGYRSTEGQDRTTKNIDFSDKAALQSKQQQQRQQFNQTYSGHRSTQGQNTSSVPVGRGSFLYRDSGSASFGFSRSNSDTNHGHYEQAGARPKVREGSDPGGPHSDGSTQERHGDKHMHRTGQGKPYNPEKYEDVQQGGDIDTHTSEQLRRRDTSTWDVHLKVLDVGTSRAKDVYISCSVDTYMKWQYIMQSPTMLCTVNGFLRTQEKGHLTEESTLEINSNISEIFLSQEELKKLVVDVIQNFANDLTVETIRVRNGQAEEIADKIVSSPLVAATHIIYAETSDDSIVYLVYIKKKEVALKHHMNTVIPMLPLQVRLPLVWEDLSHKINLKGILNRNFLGVSFNSFICKESGDFVCELIGSFLEVTRAVKKVLYYRDELKCRKHELTGHMYQAFRELKLCGILQDMIDRAAKGVCLIEEYDLGVMLYAFKDEYINMGIKVLKNQLCEKHVLLEMKSEIPAEVKRLRQNLIERGCGGVLVFESEGVVILAGLTEGVKEATELLAGKASGERDYKPTCNSEKLLNTETELLETQKLLAEDIANINNVKLVISESTKGHAFEFSGDKHDVVKSIQEFDRSKADLSIEKVSVDKDFVLSKRGAKILSQLQSDYQVKVMREEVVDNPKASTDTGDKPTRAKLDVQGNRHVWSFPTRKSLILDLLDMKDCVEPDLLIVMTEMKSGKSSVISKATKSQAKQMVVEVSVPKWQESKKDVTKKLQDSLRRVLLKGHEDNYSSVGLSLQPVGDWPSDEFLKGVLTPVLNHIQKFDQSLPTFILLCAGSLDKLKKTEALVRTNIDPDFVENTTQIELVRGELNLFEADVLVNTTSPSLDLNHGNVSAAILRSAGSGIQKECKTRYPEGVRGSSVAVTGGHNLKCQYVFHGALSGYNPMRQVECLMELRTFLMNCLERANQLKVASIAFPVIGSGNLGYPVEAVASEMFSSIERFKQERKDMTLRFVYFVVYHKDEETWKIFRAVQKDMGKHNPRETDESASGNQSDSEVGTCAQTVTVTIIGKVSAVKEAVKALKHSRERAPTDAEMPQYILNISSNQYGALMKLFPGMFEDIRDGGVEVKWEANKVRVFGKLGKVTEAVNIIKQMDKEVNDMFHINVSVTDTDSSAVESRVRQVTQRYPDVLVMHDKIMSVVHLYGKDSEIVTKAGKLLGYTAGISDDKGTTTQSMKPCVGEAASQSGMYKPTVQRSFSYTSMSRNLKMYSAGDVIVRVYVGDLLESPADCIVNAANADLMHAGGVAHVIAKRAGPDMTKQCYHISQRGPLPVGSVVETTAGLLSDRYHYILHTVGPNWYNYKPITKDSLHQCAQDLCAAVFNTLNKARELGLASVALPAISSAIFRVPREICAMQYARAVIEFTKGVPSSLKEINFVDQDETMISIIQEAFKCMLDEGRTYPVNLSVYYEAQQKQRSKSTERGKSNKNDPKESEIRSKENLGSGGMVLLQPFYSIDNGKMTCVFTTCHEICIFTGNILQLDGIDAIVCSEDRSWSAAGMVARKLLSIGGKEYAKAKQEERKTDRPFSDGDVVVTMGGRNRYPWVIHALIPNGKPPEALRDLAEDILECCAKSGFKSTVMSLLGSGSGRSDPVLCSKLLLTAYENFCVRNPGYKFILYIVNIDRDQTNVLQSVFREHIDKQSLWKVEQTENAQTPRKQSESNLPTTQHIDKQSAYRVDQAENSQTPGKPKWQGELPSTGEQESEEFEHLSVSDLTDRSISAGIGEKSRGNDQKPRGNDKKKLQRNEPVSLEISGHGQKHLDTLSRRQHKDMTASSGQGDSTGSIKQDQLATEGPEEGQHLPKGEAGADTDQTDQEETCVICMDELNTPKTLKCGHKFCTDCIEEYFKVKQACPTCFTVCGVITGDQPDGDIEIQVMRTSLAGYENYGSIGVSYRFDSGHQGPQHPWPGAWFKGINRTAYLPNTDEGRRVCAMLKVAFERRLVFTIGTSRTTGQEGVITWNDIHHKTDHRPNTQFGYPDETYLMRVKEELAAKGVTEEDIDEKFVKELNKENFFRKMFNVLSMKS